METNIQAIPELRPCGVEFDEGAHAYHLGGVELSGITPLLRQVLRLGYQGDMDARAMEAVRRKGEQGHAVHQAIMAWEDLGVKATRYPNTYDGGEWDVSPQLEAYIANRRGYDPVASEWLVSDGERWASAIDNVWQRQGDGALVLADTKTNNLDYYPGGEAGLREWLSWQLSVYAVLLERQNPGLRVAELKCNWLTPEASALWDIPRKDTALVDALLQSTWSDQAGEDGRTVRVYEHPRPWELGVGQLALHPSPALEAMGREAVAALIEVEAECARLMELRDNARAALMAAMEQAGVKSWDAGPFKATVKAGGVRRAFDSKAFKEADPEGYERWMADKAVKPSLLVTLRK